MPRHKTLTDDQEREVVARYTRGEPARVIATDMNVNRQTIQNTLHRLGIATRPDLTKHILTHEQRLLVAEACRGGMNTVVAAKTFAIGRSTVFNILREHGIVLPHGRQPTCTLNHEAFNTLTPECIYWIAFMFGDGCVHQGKGGSPVMATNLSNKDREHLVKFRSFLGSTHTIGYTVDGGNFKGSPMATYRVRSKRLVAALVERGMGLLTRHGEQLQYRKADRAPTDAIRFSPDFWRGLLDADGSLGVSNSYPYVAITGQRRLLDRFRDFLIQQGLGGLNPSPSGTIFTIGTTGAPAVAIVRLLYGDPAQSLDRKHERAKAILGGSRVTSTPYGIIYDDTEDQLARSIL